jgi:hypothetical protein
VSTSVAGQARRDPRGHALSPFPHYRSGDPRQVVLAGVFVHGPEHGWALNLVRRGAGELAEGSLLYRFSGAQEFEGAFVACSFWLVDALVGNGHADQARKLWHDLTGYASDLGLFAEEIDPATGAFLGNMPQGCPTWPCSTRRPC